MNSHSELAYIQAIHEGYVFVCVARVVGTPISDRTPT